MTVEIIGRASIAPGAKSVSELVQVLKEGRCTISEISAERWDRARFWHPAPATPGKTYTFAAGVLEEIYHFDPAIFGLSKREAMQMDPQQRLLLTLVWRALEDANLPSRALSSERVGVYVGASSLESGNLVSEDPASGSPYFMTGNTLSIVSNRISHVFGFNGPSMTIDTACSSSMVALEQAVSALEAGRIETAIVGGVNLLVHPLSFVGFAQARMLSPEGLCRAYDNNGQGYVRSEGGAALILRRSDKARQEGDRSYAKIHAIGVNSSGRTNGISLPSREAQASLLQSIYENTGIDPNDLAFVEGHGTGTRVGDPAEVWAIGQVLGKKRRAPVPIGSIKTNIGHTEPASGLFGMLKAMVALEHDLLPASLHIESLNENIDFDDLNVRVNTSNLSLLRGKRPRYAGVNSFGFGGTNVHAVISDPDPASVVDSPGSEPALFVASAHSASALSGLLREYRDRMAGADPLLVKEIAHSAAANRDWMRHRFVVEVADGDSLLEAIDLHLAGEASAGQQGEAPVVTGKIAFVFSGNGAQWAGMAVDAFHANTQFRQHFEELSALFEHHLGEKLTDLLFAPDLDVRLADTRLSQPLLFAVQASLSDCLIARGVRPELVFGHSVGEVAAAYAAKILTAAEAAELVAKRSRYQHRFAGQGKMAAVATGEEAARGFAQQHGLMNIEIAAINAPESVTISGPGEEIAAFREAARKSHIAVHILDIDYAFHHSAMEREKSSFLQDLPQLEPAEGVCSFVSSVTGEMEEGHRLDGAYWWRNVRDPVLFSAAAEKAIDAGCNLFIEISPRPILSNYIGAVAKGSSAAVAICSTLQRQATAQGVDPIAEAVARAVAHGASPDLLRHGLARNAALRLPSLPFEPTDLQVSGTTDEVDIFGRNARHPFTLLGWRTDPNSAHWKNHVDAQLFPDLAQHVVDGKPILPGSGFIEIAITAAQRHYGTENVEISNLEIVRPLELRKDRILELSTRLSPDTGVIEIRSRERMSSDDWTIHAVARSRRPLAFQDGDIVMPAQSQETVLSADQVYQTAERFGLQYGVAFQLLREAKVFGSRVVEASLALPSAPAHPYLTYNLNPMSVDAAFHALVAIFDTIAGAGGGAPYIPVRFGSIRAAGGAGCIVRALVEIQRYSGHSVKARFQLFDEHGQRCLTLEDCRFRRASLRRHQGLSSVAFHYDAVPSSIALSDKTNLALPALSQPSLEIETNSATLLLDASVLQACHEIALRLTDASGIIRQAALPEDDQFRAFLANCLFTLEDAGIATAEGDSWRISQEYTFPPLAELLREVYHEDPARVAEAVMVNTAFHDALSRLSYAGSTPDLRETRGEATLDHVLLHSPLATRRMELVEENVERILRSSGRCVRQVLELGALSPSFTARLARRAVDHGAQLTIVEPREGVRRSLELLFENDVHVNVVDLAALDTLPPADLVVAAGPTSHELLRRDEEARSAVRKAAANGGMITGADRSPSAFDDFIYGQYDNWFEGSASVEFPVGKLRTVDQHSELIAELGFQPVDLQEVPFPEGKLVTITAQGSAGAAPNAVPPREKPLLVVTESRERVALDGAAVTLAADGELGDEELLWGEQNSGDPTFVYVADRAGTSDPSRLSQRRLSFFGSLMKAITTGPDAETASVVRLVIVAPGGGPLAGEGTDEANVALWALSRVLQNEYSTVETHVIDAEMLDEPAWALIAKSLDSKTHNREWALSSDGLSEIRAVAGPAQPQSLMTAYFASARICQPADNRVDSIRWEACDAPRPERGEVLVSVEATGLNFRDVMWAMGVLPEEALEDGFAGATIGMEFAGRVSAVGAEVTDLTVGDRVMGIGPAAFATHVQVRQDGVTKFPDGMDSAAAATVPVAFLTAYYALVHLAHLRSGETVLIHGAAGGVGLAAIQIAKLKGAKVVATAGTTEKRRFLETLGADHVFDSRSLDFVSDVHKATDGQGVDVVLNSLFAEAMERSIELLKPFGRFLELGKRDYYSDRKIGLRPFRRNISYFGIDADQLLVNVPALTKEIFEELGCLFAEQKLTPLPYRAFAHDEIGSAFRLMQNAGHIGKIVVRPPVAKKDPVLSPPQEPVRFSGEGMFLVAGGVGGFGLAAAHWLVERGVRSIALCSRRGIADEPTLEALERWKAMGVVASVHACDITDESQLAELLEALRAIAPLRGVVHAAMVLDDALLSNLTAERNQPVIDVKVKGADNLHRLTRRDDLELFLLFSSVTTLLGNPGQANYVLGNGYLEGLARVRRSAGLPALAVGFGAIADVGFLTRNAEVNELLAKRIGKTAMKARDALHHVENYMRIDPGTVASAAVVIADVDWSSVRMLPISHTAYLDVVKRGLTEGDHSDEGDTIDLENMVRGRSQDEAYQILHRLLAKEIASILRVTEESITPDKVLKDIGLDSLMAMELGMSFQQKTGYDIPLSAVGDSTTVREVVVRLLERVSSRDANADESSVAAPEEVSRLLHVHSPARQERGGAR
ncbi:MAG TPA: SDR family NAD(P)-dependent oxidoreductase [Pseudorhizobium sp.]|nr:SDR family NAD(P)-dependent oxidoreductase [Pseudorhizobium sp.]